MGVRASRRLDQPPKARPRAAPSELLSQRVELPCLALVPTACGVGGSCLRLRWQAEGAPSCIRLPSLPERVAAAGQAAGHDAWPAVWGRWPGCAALPCSHLERLAPSQPPWAYRCR